MRQVDTKQAEAEPGTSQDDKSKLTFDCNEIMTGAGCQIHRQCLQKS
jgi:hypothetical protein